jgi:hypothetical protein
MIFKVLKKYGDYKKGEEFDSAEVELEITDIEEAIAGGFIAEKEVESGPETVSTSKKVKKEAIAVSFNGGIREFSLAIHGENFMDVASEFATTHNGTIME